MAGFFGTMRADNNALYTGTVEGAITVTLGDHDKALHVVLLPNGNFEIQMTDTWGDQVGYIVPPREGQKGTRILTGKLNTDIKR